VTGPKAQLLLVEDDLRLAALVQEFLTQQDFTVAIESRGDRAVKKIIDTLPDLVILDWMLPGMNGLDVCRAVRTRYSGPIVMLTARDDDIDQILGLEIGADDYLIKPVEPRVLLARIRSLIRRHKQLALVADAVGQSLRFDRLLIDPRARRVTLNDLPVSLSTNEFDLLWLLASHAGRPLSRRFILANLRNIDYDGMDRSIDIGVSRLRKKLDDDSELPTKIKTVRGKGYLFVSDAWG
jgi:two-component system, OmpR family, response regulator